MKLKTQEVWSELFEEHFLVSVYDWGSCNTLMFCYGCSILFCVYSSFNYNVDCICRENIKDLLDANQRALVKIDLSACKFF